LDSMLVFDPSHRASPAEVAASSWLFRHMPTQPTVLQPDLSFAPSARSYSSSHSDGIDRRAGGQPTGGIGAREATAEATHPSKAQPLNESVLDRLERSANGQATRVERQDSASTAHSIGSSVGSSVVQSLGRLRALDTGYASRGRDRAHTAAMDGTDVDEPLIEVSDETDRASRWDGVRYAIAGTAGTSSSRRSASSVGGAQSSPARTEVCHLAELQGRPKGGAHRGI